MRYTICSAFNLRKKGEYDNGIPKIFLKGNSADGIREAMRFTYKKVSGHKFLFDIDNQKHQKGMIVALQSRYRTFGIEQTTDLIMNEISIFLVISSQEIALDALCEYIVYKEKPIDAKIAGLKNVLNETLRTGQRSPWHGIAAAASGFPEYIEWADLIEDSIKQKMLKLYEDDEDDDKGP